MGKTISPEEAMSMNRHARRVLASINKTAKIPSIKNFVKKVKDK